MIPVARRMIWSEKSRFFITAGGVGLTVMLMLFLLGIYEGVKRGAVGYVQGSTADIWVCGANSTNILRSSSFLPASLAPILRQTPGVRSVSGILRVLTTTKIKGKPVTLFVLGFEPEQALAAPARMIAGSPRIGTGEIIVDKAFAGKHRLTLGDRVEIQGRRFSVGGICEGTNAIVTQFVFAPLDDARALIGFPGSVSFFLISLEPETDLKPALDRLKKVHPRLAFFGKAEFMNNNLDEMKTGILPIFWMIAMLGGVIGAAIIALMLYGTVLERRPDYALLKAVGAGQGFLWFLVLKQSWLGSLAGFSVGLLLEILLAPVLTGLMPELSLTLRPGSILAVGTAEVLIGTAGAWVPVRKLARILPLEAFR